MWNEKIVQHLCEWRTLNFRLKNLYASLCLLKPLNFVPFFILFLFVALFFFKGETIPTLHTVTVFSESKIFIISCVKFECCASKPRHNHLCACFFHRAMARTSTQTQNIMRVNGMLENAVVGGRMYYEDGSIYEGEWCDDERSGQGMLRLSEHICIFHFYVWQYAIWCTTVAIFFSTLQTVLLGNIMTITSDDFKPNILKYYH